MSGIDTSALRKFSASLRTLPTVVAQKVAAAAAPALTDAALATFNAGETAYGDTWKIREDGTRATLDQSGMLKRGISYVAIGTRIRVALAVSYAKYVIGRRPVFPRQGQTLPAAYSEALAKATQTVIAAEMGGAS